MQPTLILITGGTLDKDYNAISGELGFSESHLPKIIKQANCTLALRFNQVLLKDSLEMNEQDRHAILEAIIDANESQIVITHGTDTMSLTAEYIQKQKTQHPALEQKTIVLTGAMRPFQLGESDASFNLGTALMASQLQTSGIYIAMNGQCHSAEKVAKNRKLGVFEAS